MSVFIKSSASTISAIFRWRLYQSKEPRATSRLHCFGADFFDLSDVSHSGGILAYLVFVRNWRLCVRCVESGDSFGRIVKFLNCCYTEKVYPMTLLN